jgi:hypothetical protein
VILRYDLPVVKACRVTVTQQFPFVHSPLVAVSSASDHTGLARSSP